MELSLGQSKSLTWLSLCTVYAKVEGCGIGAEGVYWLGKAKWKQLKVINLGIYVFYVAENGIGD